MNQSKLVYLKIIKFLYEGDDNNPKALTDKGKYGPETFYKVTASSSPDALSYFTFQPGVEGRFQEFRKQGREYQAKVLTLKTAKYIDRIKTNDSGWWEYTSRAQFIICTHSSKYYPKLPIDQANYFSDLGGLLGELKDKYLTEEGLNLTFQQEMKEYDGKRERIDQSIKECKAFLNLFPCGFEPAKDMIRKYQLIDKSGLTGSDSYNAKSIGRQIVAIFDAYIKHLLSTSSVGANMLKDSLEFDAKSKINMVKKFVKDIEQTYINLTMHLNHCQQLKSKLTTPVKGSSIPYSIVKEIYKELYSYELFSDWDELTSVEADYTA